MRESNVKNEEMRIEIDELEPVILGQVSEITGTSAAGGGDRDNIVWGEL